MSILLSISFFTVNQPTPPSVDCMRGNCEKSQQAQESRQSSKSQYSGKPVDSSEGKGPLMIDPDQLAADLKRFCLFRNDGDHALPANCDVFIKCSHGVGSYGFCRNGTKFNPWFSTCDHPIYHECKFDSRKFYFLFLFNLVCLEIQN